MNARDSTATATATALAPSISTSASMAGMAGRLDEARAALSEIRVLLEHAVADAASPTNDIGALAQWAQRRVDVQARVLGLERTALSALSALSTRAAGPSADGRAALLELGRLDPPAAADVRERVARLGTLTGALRDADQRRSALLHKCRDTVRGYLAAVNPPARAYGPGGERTPTSDLPASTRGSA